MIALHRLTHPDEPLWLNPDHIATAEATPDTVLTLQGGGKLVVMETPAEVAGRIRDWRASIIALAALGETPSG